MTLIGLCGIGVAAETPTPSVTVTVHPQSVSLNGRNELPMGMLGVHNVPLDEARVADWGVTGTRVISHNPGGVTRIPEAGARAAVQAQLDAATDRKERRRLQRQLGRILPHTLEWAMDCFYDRYQPALQISHPTDWEERLRNAVRAFVDNARKSGQQHYLEFWNEPYLNWATSPAVNYSPSYYVTEGVQPGDPMVLRATGEAVPGLEWGDERFWVRERGQINYVISGYIGQNARPGRETRLRYGAGRAVLEDGGTVTIRNKEWPLSYGRWGRDPEQKHYWSGPVNVRLYNEMLAVVGDELEQLEAADEIPLAGGWGFNIFNENWDSWRYLIKPTIDATHQYIDAIHEHHYGGDVRMVGISYEVAYSYAQAMYDRRLDFWNTEAGGHLDPQQPGNTLPHNTGDALTKARAAMTYLLRDVAYQWAHVPDKALFRAAHHSHHNGGDAWAFRLLKQQGGTLLRVDDDGQRVWAVATTDADESQVLLFNDGRSSETVRVRVPVASGEATVAVVATVDGKLRITERAVAIDDHALDVVIEPISALRITLPRIAPTSQVHWTQYASADVLQELSAPVSTTIAVPADALAAATDARIRLVTSQPYESLTVAIGGRSQRLEGVPMGISDHSLSAELRVALATETAVTVRTDAGSGRLFAVSLWLSPDGQPD